MKVFVTGATGFVGSEVLRQLLAAGHLPRCLVRRGSEEKLAVRDAIEVCPGDFDHPDSLDGALEGCDAVIHLVGIIREFPERKITFQRLHVEATRHLIAAAQAQGVQRFLHMSANGSRADAVAPYHQSKWQAEEALRASTLDWTIFRPSLICGRGDSFVTLLADMVRRFPVVPVIGDGDYRLSPVAVGDVAASFVKALQLPQTIGQSYQCCGARALSYNQILDAIAKALGKDGVTKLHHPLLLMKPLIALLEGFPVFPITRNQLTMLLEGNSCDPAPWAETFALTPTPLETVLSNMLRP